MKPLLFLFIMISISGFGQVWDDFSDGNFTRNPSWSGDISQFEVNEDFQLQLQSEGEDVSHLATLFSMDQETEWRFFIDCSFSPSANNNTRFYLAADALNLETPQTGYYLQFGESGSDDAIELFRQNGETTTSICRGTDGLISSSFELWIRVRKDAQGNWTVEADPTGNGAYLTEATGSDNTISSSSYLGLVCTYTTSNADNFYFDDVYAGPFVVDTDPPELQQIAVTSENSLELVFNEALDVSTVENTAHYYVSNQIGNPITADLNPENPALVSLVFGRNFPNGDFLTINIQNLADLAGNVMEPVEENFVYFMPAAFDIQINEIMADPNPPVGLPEWEYLELYNRTNLPVDLTGWKLIIGTSDKNFENVIIEPGGYLILGDEEAANEFTFSGPFYGFSSFSLTNTGQSVTLINPEGAVISTVSYTNDWYRNQNKDDGGWSLEQIDPMNPCGGVNNWVVAISPYGGTPGSENSVFGENPDNNSPVANRIEFEDDNTLILHFSEPMDSLLLFEQTVYEIAEIGNPDSALPVWPDYSRVRLVFPNDFQPSEIYTLQITNENLTDCAGNNIDLTKRVSFGRPEEITENDIVINEVLFNPSDQYVDGVDFVEIVNRSQKILDLKDLLLCTEDEDTGELDSPKEVSAGGYLFFPGEYLVLTTDPEVVKTQYFTENQDAFIQMESLPSYTNDEGVVLLATKGFVRIDRMEYSESMQYPLLSSADGVSLERINFDRPSDDPTNWHSAAETVGFATPGYLNSQFSMIVETDDPITVEPEIFSPDSDGVDDVLNIGYKFNTPGKNCKIHIYDSRGRPVRMLVDNEFIGTEGQFSWDGLTDDNQKAGVGIYVIFVEIFDTEGHTENYKKTAVLGTRF